MREIALVRSTEVALVDDEDYIYLNKFTWRLHLINGRKYAMRAKYDKMHRYILVDAGNNDIDHIDHNGLNNQRSNLRVCSRTQNSRNQKPKQGKYKGVTFIRRRAAINKPFMARIGINKKQLFIGNFKTAIEAAKAYNKEAIKYFGEFACLNIIYEEKESNE